MPAPGVSSLRIRRMTCSARRSVCVTTSVGDDLRPTRAVGPSAAPTTWAAERAATVAMRSSSAGSGRLPRSRTADRDAVARQELDGVLVDAGVGHEHVDLVERGEGEHLVVAELGLVDQGDHAARTLHHGPLD